MPFNYDCSLFFLANIYCATFWEQINSASEYSLNVITFFGFVFHIKIIFFFCFSFGCIILFLAFILNHCLSYFVPFLLRFQCAVRQFKYSWTWNSCICVAAGADCLVHSFARSLISFYYIIHQEYTIFFFTHLSPFLLLFRLLCDSITYFILFLYHHGIMCCVTKDERMVQYRC